MPEPRAKTGSSSRSTAPADSHSASRSTAPEAVSPITASDSRGGAGEVPLGVALSPKVGESGTVTARKAGGLRDMGLEVDPLKVGVQGALQHLAEEAINISVSDRLWGKLP